MVTTAMPPAMPPRHLGTLEREGYRLHYEVTGSGPTLVFAHGLGGNQMSWWQQIAHFAPRFTCVTFAHRGFAPSSAVPGGPDPAAFAGDLAALIEHLAFANVRLIAQSMGGWASVEYALRKTGKLQALVLAATTGTVDPRRFRDRERARLETWTQASERARADCVRRGIHVAAGTRMAAEQPALHLLYRHIDDMNAHLDKEVLRARLMAGRTRAPEELAGIGCPLLCIAGDEDIVIPPFAADAIAAAVPMGCAAHVADGGHSVYFERAAIFNRLVEDFLAGV